MRKKKAQQKKKLGVTKKKEGENFMKAKLGQNWSLDLIIGVIVFIMVIAVFYAFLNTETEPDFQKVQEDARAAVAKISTTSPNTAEINLVKEGVIDKEAYDDLCEKTYEEVRTLLNIESEFCIYLEDYDRSIVLCENGRAGIGNGRDFLLSNESGNAIYCGEIVGEMQLFLT